MRRILKWTLVTLLAPVVLLFLITLLLYFPPVQNWAVSRVAAYASEQTGMNVSVGHVRLSFPLDLLVENVLIVDCQSGTSFSCDTVADVERMVVDVQLLPLFSKQVEIDQLALSNVKLNTTHLIEAAQVKGFIGRLSLESHGIDLASSVLKVDTATLENATLNVLLRDSVPEDTTENTNDWNVLVDHLNVRDTDISLHMPGDTLRLQAYFGDASATNGAFDLERGRYRVNTFDLKGGRVSYDNRFATLRDGLDYNHLSLTDLVLGIDSLLYENSDLSMRLRACSFKEKSGIQVNELSGKVSLRDGRLTIPDMTFRTPDSSLAASIDMDLDTFDTLHPGTLSTTVHGSFGKQDLLRVMGSMPASVQKSLPNYPVRVDGRVNGNMERMSFAGLNVNWQGAFNLNATGYVSHLDDPKHIQADVDLNVRTYRLDFLTAMLDKDLRKQVRIPDGISLNGNVKVDGNRYAANLTAHEGNGSVKVDGKLDAATTSYQAKVAASAFPLQHFLPKMGLSPLTATLSVKGQGTNFFASPSRKGSSSSSAGKLDATFDIKRFRYVGYDLSGMHGDASVSNGRARATMTGSNGLFDGTVSAEALLRTGNIRGIVSADLNKIDLYALHVTHEPFHIGFCGQVDLATNGSDSYDVQGVLGDVVVWNRGEQFRLEDVACDILTRRDTTHAVVDCGDFHLLVDAGDGYERLLNSFSQLSSELLSQLKERTIDHLRLRRHFPQMSMRLSSGTENFVAKMASRLGYSFKSVDFDMTSSSLEGLNGSLAVDSLVVSGVQLDLIRLSVKSDAEQMTYEGQVRNGADNPQYTFNALFNGDFRDRGTHLTMQLFDAADKLGVALGVAATMEDHGLRFRSYGMDPVLGYKTFKVNADNYVFLSDDRRVSADIVLRAADGAGVQVYTDDDNQDALQDITFSLHQFDLEKVLTILPYTPELSGVMNGDFHLIQTSDHLSVSSNLSVDKMTFEKCPMGDISTEFVYMPLSDGSHYVDGILMRDDDQVGSLRGTYRSADEGYLDATLSLDHFPLSFANGFIPDQLFGLKGYAEGDLTLRGPLSKPLVNGEVFLDESSVFSAPYGVDLRIANDPVRIVNSHLLFENFEIFAHNESPLNIAGSLDFSDPSRMTMDVRMRAQNFQLIHSKENSRSEAYGNAFVNFFGMMSGPVDNLRMRGKLDVLGTTDMTYVLRDSPLTTDNQLKELVAFTDFSDTTEVIVERPPLTGFNMDLTVDVSNGAHIMAYLNADHTNYIDLMGGGTLRMQYTPADDFRLRGRYTLANGEMKYALPVIPLKTFTIQDGSYIEFTGAPMNPTLNITAIERNKATVTGVNGVGHSVNFDCGVIITKTLQDMGLEFTLDAPEDLSLHSELQMMSKEQRGKLAVTMLTTGMYIADGNTGGFSMNSALSSFLESEINNITGNALRTLDFSIGLDNSTDASGNMHTDYSFKFSKRFWNNRLKVSVGGMVSTGSDIENRDDSFFDNVSLEYRLDDTANKYISVYYENNVYDWLDGYTQKFGAGFIWRRTLQHFRDIFRTSDISSSVAPPPSVRKDSIASKAPAADAPRQASAGAHPTINAEP